MQWSRSSTSLTTLIPPLHLMKTYTPGFGLRMPRYRWLQDNRLWSTHFGAYALILGGQTLAGILQKGDPGMVTLSQMRPSLDGQQLWPHKLDINSKSTMYVGERAEGSGGAGILYKRGYISVGRKLWRGTLKKGAVTNTTARRKMDRLDLQFTRRTGGWRRIQWAGGLDTSTDAGCLPTISCGRLTYNITNQVWNNVTANAEARDVAAWDWYFVAFRSKGQHPSIPFTRAQ